MIMTVTELRQYINTTETDAFLQLRLDAIEKTIQGVTNNNFNKYIVDGVIEYPADIKMGTVNLVKWDLEYREKVGVASESISRHSTTYIAQDKANTNAGYPAALMGFLRPYRKVQIGQGVTL